MQSYDATGAHHGERDVPFQLSDTDDMEPPLLIDQRDVSVLQVSVTLTMMS